MPENLTRRELFTRFLQPPVVGNSPSEAESKGHEPVAMCHSTGSDTNPYVFIAPDCESANFRGHLDHGGDIIPPFTCDETPIPGKNWDEQGQVIFNNGCNVPVTATPEQPSPEPSTTPIISTPEPKPSPTAEDTPVSTTPTKDKTPTPPNSPTLTATNAENPTATGTLRPGETPKPSDTARPSQQPKETQMTTVTTTPSGVEEQSPVSGGRITSGIPATIPAGASMGVLGLSWLIRRRNEMKRNPR